MWKLGAMAAPESAGALARSGFDYLELHCEHLRPEVSDAAFARLRDRLAEAALPVEVCSGFLPRDFKIVGPDVGWSRFTTATDVELSRASQLGAKLVVWANGPARWVPQGFPRPQAMKQFVEAGRYVAKVARANGLQIALEALNSSSGNFILLLDEALEAVKEIAEPEIAPMADMYHMCRNGEPPGKMTVLGERLAYVHLCDQDRRPPGSNREERSAYEEVAGALRSFGYCGRVSIEAEWRDLEIEAPIAASCLREWMAEPDPTGKA